MVEQDEAARDTTVEQDGTTPTVAGAERDTADLQSGMVAEAPEAASGDGEAEQQSEYGYNRARYEAEAAAGLAIDSLGTNLSGLASMLTQTMRQDDKSPSRTAADKGGTPTPEPGKAEEIESTQVVQDALKKLKETATSFLHTSSKATSERDGTQAVGTTVEQDGTTPTVAGAERDTADLQSGMVAEAPEAARDTTVEQDGTTPTVAGAERDTADLQSGMVAEAPEAASGDGEAEQQSEYGYNRARYEAEAAAELVMDSLGTNLSGLASMLTQTMRQDDKSPSRTAADKGGTPTPEPGKAEEIESTQVVQDALKKLKETATSFLHTSSTTPKQLIRKGWVEAPEAARGTTVEQDDTPTPTVAGAERDTADLQSGMVAEAPEAASGEKVEQQRWIH